jgi:hypothetical protein
MWRRSPPSPRRGCVTPSPFLPLPYFGASPLPNAIGREGSSAALPNHTHHPETSNPKPLDPRPAKPQTLNPTSKIPSLTSTLYSPLAMAPPRQTRTRPQHRRRRRRRTLRRRAQMPPLLQKRGRTTRLPPPPLPPKPPPLPPPPPPRARVKLCSSPSTARVPRPPRVNRRLQTLRPYNSAP